jgi:hypothetical protein
VHKDRYTYGVFWGEFEVLLRLLRGVSVGERVSEEDAQEGVDGRIEIEGGLAI